MVGLGNPGERYRRTRHNAGFMVVDALAARAGVTRWRDEADSLVTEAEVGGEEVRLVKPLTFMNRSGVAVARLARGHGWTSADLVGSWTTSRSNWARCACASAAPTGVRTACAR